MKRLAVLTILAIILAGLSAVCIAGNKLRVLSSKIALPEPKLMGPLSLEQALAKRRSVRQFAGQQLDFVQIGQLAWAGQGITEKQRGFRTAPSAGAIYPIRLYFATQKGLFVYNAKEHSLEKTLGVDIRDRLSEAALGQRWVAEAGCDIIIAGSERKLAARYHNRAKQYMLLEAGHIAQNILLQAVSLELGAVPVGAFETRQVSKVCKLPTSMEPVYIICVGYPAEQAAPETEKGKSQVRKTDESRVKKAVLIIASANFRDEELFETKRILDEAGLETVVASSRTGPVKGMLGSVAEATVLLNELRVDDYDAIVFVGGPGATEYFNNPAALSIAGEAAYKRKVLGAICIAPSVLANAGVLKGRRATCFPSERDRLQKAGARYTGTAVERDGLIITGNGPRAARLFGRAIADAVMGR